MIHGKNRIGFELKESNSPTLAAINPENQQNLDGDFHDAQDSDINEALDKAELAFDVYKNTSGAQRADFLEAIGEEILALGDVLVQRVMNETALPEGRIVGERGRTIGQLNLFASILRQGSWVEASIDTAIPDRQPVPKPDIRKMLIPVGPVVVFTASNFPLAFSTAGGDTASALAAGNPVIVKAHESHLGTNELISNAIAMAAQKTGMPDGVFSSLAGSGYDLGKKLVMHPKTKSIAFTGSFRGGMALYNLATKREEPIPVFAEMGSINPVVLLPDQLETSAASLAETYAASITLGVGQFCTSPGLLIGLDSPALDSFMEVLGKRISETKASSMLNAGIADAFIRGKTKVLNETGVLPLCKDTVADKNAAKAMVATVSAQDFVENPALHHEVFGPFSLLVKCKSESELDQLILSLKGQLTATVMATDKDVEHFETSIKKLTSVVGRLIFNGVPTGVDVCHSMHHGGPFPASTDSRFTSVGADAIKRFVRPLSYQNCPKDFLPKELDDKNTLGIWRKVNGELTRDGL